MLETVWQKNLKLQIFEPSGTESNAWVASNLETGQ